MKHLTHAALCAILSGFVLPTAALAERELTSDRPDATESPFTVEPGRVQLEASLAQYTHDRHNAERADVRVTAWAVAPFNLRVGLTPTSEIQFVVDSYLDVKVEDRDEGATERLRGFGDVTLRAKWNLWGNDGGPSAFGVMPFVKLPTARDGLGNDRVEGGVILPFAKELSGGWGFAAMTELDVVRNVDDDSYAPRWINTATVGRDLTERLGFFVELATDVGEGSPVISGNGGFTYAINKDLQLDLGVNIGLSRAADDLSVFAGFVSRF